KSTFPLVYSCSGCSSAAQAANQVALELDRMGVAEMSCIAGIGGDVKPILKLATSGRPLAVIDGCPLLCARSCLARHGIEPDLHWQLAEHGVKKRFHHDVDPGQARTMTALIAQDIQALVAARGALAVQYS
uniref:putative zinc-binding protein n=1 Tax=Massilia oculi TaxID=945844 RepID=UPI0028AE28BD